MSTTAKQATEHLDQAQTEFDNANQRRFQETIGLANRLIEQESIKAEAFKRLPVVMEQWADVVRQNMPLFDELRSLAKVANVSIPFGYGLLPDLGNPVIGTTEVEL